jgi:hypothetical protein
MGVGNRRNKDMGEENIWHKGRKGQPDTVCSLVIFSSQPPKEEGRLG